MLYTFILFLAMFVVIFLALMVLPPIKKNMAMENKIIFNVWVTLLLTFLISLACNRGVSTELVNCALIFTGVSFLIEYLYSDVSKKPKNKS